MSDPRNNPIRRANTGNTGMWGWIAGLAVLVLIAIVLIAGWNNNPNTASTNAPPATTGSATPAKPLSPPATTGSGPVGTPPPVRQ